MDSSFRVSSKITMPTIKARKQANGSTRYTAIVRIRRGTTARGATPRALAQRAAECGEASLLGGFARRFDHFAASVIAHFSSVLRNAARVVRVSRRRNIRAENLAGAARCMARDPPRAGGR